MMRKTEVKTKEPIELRVTCKDMQQYCIQLTENLSKNFFGNHEICVIHFIGVEEINTPESLSYFPFKDNVFDAVG